MAVGGRTGKDSRLFFSPRTPLRVAWSIHVHSFSWQTFFYLIVRVKKPGGIRRGGQIPRLESEWAALGGHQGCREIQREREISHPRFLIPCQTRPETRERIPRQPSNAESVCVAFSSVSSFCDSSEHAPPSSPADMPGVPRDWVPYPRPAGGARGWVWRGNDVEGVWICLKNLPLPNLGFEGDRFVLNRAVVSQGGIGCT